MRTILKRKSSPTHSLEFVTALVHCSNPCSKQLYKGLSEERKLQMEKVKEVYCVVKGSGNTNTDAREAEKQRPFVQELSDDITKWKWLDCLRNKGDVKKVKLAQCYCMYDMSWHTVHNMQQLLLKQMWTKHSRVTFPKTLDSCAAHFPLADRHGLSCRIEEKQEERAG